MNKDSSGGIFISKAPTDPDEKQKWVNQMMRIQFAFFVDDHAKCEHCGHQYTSVDDMLNANTRRGHTKEMSFVCSKCYEEYAKNNPIKETSK